MFVFVLRFVFVVAVVAVAAVAAVVVVVVGWTDIIKRHVK